MDRLKRLAAPLAGLVLFSVALLVLRRELAGYHYREIAAQLRAVPIGFVLAAIALTALDYLVLSTYDLLALRHIRRKLDPRKVAFASFTGYALSHNIGFSVLTGGSVRYRFYSAVGLSAVEITELVAFCTLTFWLGFLLLGGSAFLLAPPSTVLELPFPHVLLRPVGALLLALLAAYLAIAALPRRRTLTVRGIELRRPGLPVALVQLGLSTIDWSLAAGVLFVLLPSSEGLGYLEVLSIFLVAQIVGVASQVPGGLGVFETVALLLLSPHLPKEQILGALLAFRGIYYLLPLLVATVSMGVFELLERRAGVAKLTSALGRAAAAIVPQILALATLAAGAILLFSGATPPAHGRLTLLKALVPIPLIEASHFAGSLIGASLLVLAQGIQRRLDVAWHLAVGLLAVGILASLLKGFDYEEAAILGMMLVAMLPCRRHFRRKTSLVTERFTPRWIATIALVTLGTVWLFFFAHRHIELSGEAWWHFSLLGRGEGSRSLRATVGAVAALSLFGLFLLVKPARARPARPGPAILPAVRRVIEASPSTMAWLALLGDKSFIFSESGRTFVMYAVSGRSWTAMGDPVGPVEEWPEVAWRLREESDLHSGWTVFYQASAAGLPAYVDLGLTLIKLGEEARVPLEGFTLSGTANKHFRATVNRLDKEGCEFAVVPSGEVPGILPELRIVSDAWLSLKSTREKRFSMGRFEEAYLSQLPVAVLRQHGRISAFANLWIGAGYEEISVDLMRYLPDAPGGTMDYLFVKLMLWGAENGYRWFDLGMAPLSGLENRALAPLWNRLGALVFRQGEHFYNFYGIRAYKDKFRPRWEPRYLASPGGLALPRILASIAALTSGGLRGVVSR